MDAYEELPPTATQDPYTRQVPKWTTLPRPESPGDQLLSRMTTVAGIRFTKRTAGLSLQVGVQNSISSAGWKLCTFLQTTGPWSLLVSDLSPGAEPEPPEGRETGESGTNTQPIDS